jgi:hypothetical protein
MFGFVRRWWYRRKYLQHVAGCVTCSKVIGSGLPLNYRCNVGSNLDWRAKGLL